MLSVSCVDLFCGAGGLTHGLALEGLRVNAGIDMDPVCRHPYEANNAGRFIECDISSLGVKNVRLEQYSERVYRVLWSLSDTSGGELRRPLVGPAPAGPSGAPRLTAGAVPDADMIRSRGGCARRRYRQPAAAPGRGPVMTAPRPSCGSGSLWRPSAG